MTPVADPAYVAAVLAMYIDLPDTPIRVNAQDRGVARKLKEDGAVAGHRVRSAAGFLAPANPA